MPAGNAAELNQALKRVKEKDITKSFHCVFAMLCIVIGKEWNEQYFEQDKEKSGIVWRENNVSVILCFSFDFGVYGMGRGQEV